VVASGGAFVAPAGKIISSYSCESLSDPRFQQLLSELSHRGFIPGTGGVLAAACMRGRRKAPQQGIVRQGWSQDFWGMVSPKGSKDRIIGQKIKGVL
jgi:hypothetical protein